LRVADVEPAWSPDGREIAFARSRTDAGNYPGQTGPAQIYVVNADGTDVRRLTSAGDNDSPAWSPDGKRIAFDRGPCCVANDVYVMDADGRHQHRLTTDGKGYDVFNTGPLWFPDGKTIAFAKVDQEHVGPANRSGPWVINADGSHPRRLKLAADSVPDSWS